MRASRIFLGLLFMAAGACHFAFGPWYLRAMPQFLPAKMALIYFSGACEIGLGALLLIPACEIPAAWGLVALLIAVFPANVHMALHTPDFPVQAWLLWARLPLQLVLIGWVYWLTKPAQATAPAPPRLPPR